MSRLLRRMLAGVGVILIALLLGWLFLGYQMPELLLDWANLRYCG